MLMWYPGVREPVFVCPFLRIWFRIFDCDVADYSLALDAFVFLGVESILCLHEQVENFLADFLDDNFSTYAEDDSPAQVRMRGGVR